MKYAIIIVSIVMLLSSHNCFSQVAVAPAASATEKIIEISTTVQLSYVEQGRDTGIPVILLHGYTDSWRSYELVLPFLPSSLKVFAISQRGHGNSTKSETHYSPDDFADDVAGFMQEQKIKQAIIVGHSMGSVIAQNFALRYPEKTKAIVLVGSFASFGEIQEMIEFSDVINGLQDPIDRSFVVDFQKSTLFNEVPEGYFDTIVGESLKVPAQVWKGAWKGLLESGYADRVQAIKKPTLIIWGDKDIYSPAEDQQLIQQNIEGSTLVVYEETGHAVHWERPERFAQDLVSFVDGLTLK